jgi:hypothetical protein
VAGAFVYWRASDRRRSRELAEVVESGIDEGRRRAGTLVDGLDDSRSTV